jgi:hypothetical protein
MGLFVCGKFEGTTPVVESGCYCSLLGCFVAGQEGKTKQQEDKNTSEGHRFSILLQ